MPHFGVAATSHPRQQSAKLAEVMDKTTIEFARRITDPKGLLTPPCRAALSRRSRTKTDLSRRSSVALWLFLIPPDPRPRL
jgi:hypothetical protein